MNVKNEVIKTKYTDDEIIEGFKRLYEKLGRKPKMWEINIAHLNDELCSKNVIKRKFKSIDELCKIFGIDIKGCEVTKEDIIKAYKKLSIDIGAVPTGFDINVARNKGLMYSETVIRKFFKSIKELRDAAGIYVDEDFSKGVAANAYDEISIIKMYEKLSEELGRPATATDIKKASKNKQMCSYDTILKHFKGISMLRKKSNINIQTTTSSKDCMFIKSTKEE